MALTVVVAVVAVAVVVAVVAVAGLKRPSNFDVTGLNLRSRVQRACISHLCAYTAPYILA